MKSLGKGQNSFTFAGVKRYHTKLIAPLHSCAIHPHLPETDWLGERGREGQGVEGGEKGRQRGGERGGEKRLR